MNTKISHFITFIMMFAVGLWLVPLQTEAAMLTYTFDDGSRYIYENAYPVMKKYNHPGVAYAISERVADYYDNYIHQDQFEEMQENGWEIGSHSVSHRRTTQLPRFYVDEFLRGWERAPGYKNTYKVQYAYNDLALVYVGGERFWGKKASVNDVDTATQGYYFDNDNNYVYIHLRDNGDPENYEIRVGSAQREIQQSYSDLVSQGLNVSSFVAPYGDFDDSLMEFISPLYSSIVGSIPYEQNYNFLPLSSRDLPIRLTRMRSTKNDNTVEDLTSVIDESIAEDAWIILTFHAIYDDDNNHNYTDPYGWSKGKFEQLVSYINSTGVSVVTISEGLALQGTNDETQVPVLYFPYVVHNDDWRTKITLINNSGEQSFHGVLKAYSADGVELARKFVNLATHGRREVYIDCEFDNPEVIAYLTIFSATGNIIGYAKFNHAGLYRTAVPAVSKVNNGTILITHIASDNDWWTLISLLNTTVEERHLTLIFNDGRQKTLTLAAGERKVFQIRDLFAGISQSTLQTVIIEGANGIVGLELFGSSGSRKQLSGVELGDHAATTLYYPHVAESAQWWTGIVTYNLASVGNTINITPYTEMGVPLASQSLVLDGGSRYVGSCAGLDFPADTAWFRIDAELPISGFELFGTNDGNQLAGYTSVNIQGRVGVFAELEKQGWTGIAFVNCENRPVTVHLAAYTDEGTIVATRDMTLEAYAKVVNTPDEIFNSEITMATSIQYNASSDVVGFQLNGSANGMLLDGLQALH